MNISNLSQETLVKLVELAINSAPTKAAYIILEGIPVIEIPTVVEVVEKKPELSYYETVMFKERQAAFSKIVQAVLSRDKVAAIRELRTISGLGLKQAKDTIEMAFTEWFSNIGDMGSADDYWVRAIFHFFKKKEVILN
jgi:ribosomal protein L7/L12